MGKKAIDSKEVPIGQINDSELKSAVEWQQVVERLPGLPNRKGINMAYEAVDRHVVMGKGDKAAIRWCSKSGRTKEYTYTELQQLTNKFANVLDVLGFAKGDAFFGLAPRLPELYIGVLGALKHRCTFSPLFSAFGPEPIKARMEIGQAKVLMTTEALYKRKVAKIIDELASLKKVIIIDLTDPNLGSDERLVSYADLMEAASTAYEVAETPPELPALIHFTSGTTGKPKGALHVHGAVVYQHISGQYALNLHADDVYWCTADPGWVTGTTYGIIAPLTNGVTMVIDEGEFDAERWYQIIQNQRVNVWYTAPTAIRMMMKLGEDLVKKYDTSSLRFIGSVGEPLNPEAIRWSQLAFGLPIHDNWWQTETGGIMIANYYGEKIKLGSMGRPMPGIEATILHEDSGRYTQAAVGVEGQLAIKAPWPSMFRTYLGEQARYQKCFTPDGWYLSGDLAKMDGDGYFWFVGRADDVIKSAGHLIGPFEVESTLIEHPKVAEAAVIGKPDKLLMETVKAFVVLNPGVTATPDLKREIFAFARKKLGPAVAPRELDIVATLPKTRSGKIMRRLLKARELGLPEGDTSTLESEPSLNQAGDR